ARGSGHGARHCHSRRASLDAEAAIYVRHGRRSSPSRVGGRTMFQFWLDFINSVLKKDDSSQLAAGRLKGAIFLDRLTLSPATLDQIRHDVVRTISRYLIIDETAMTLAVQAQGRTVALA